MSAIRWIVPCASLVLAGCGLRVPEIQENPFSPGDGQLMVQSIVQSVHCEVINALKHVVEKDIEFSKKYHQRRVTEFLYKWGVQLSLTLTIDEKSSLSPNSVWLPHSPPTSIFTLATGASVSSDATRTDKMSFYYTVPTLLKQTYCTTGVRQGNEGSPLVRSDLKLEEWLADYLSPLGTQEGQAPTGAGGILKTNVLSHDVKFDLVTSGGVTPAWKLTTATVNQSGTLFSTSRDRTHDLIITLGPGDKTGFTTDAPRNADAAQQIGNAVSTNLKLLGQ